MNGLSRRGFLVTAAGSAAFASSLGWAADATDDTPWRGEKIVDCHFHERASLDSMIAHIQGSGTTSALMMGFGDSAARYAELHKKYPEMFIGWSRGAQGGHEGDKYSPFDMASLVTAGASKDALEELKKLKKTHWKGFSESGAPVDADGPEMDRLFALSSELDVPIMMHFQKNGLPGQPPRPGRGFSHVEPLLKKYPKARLIGHASDFWGHIDGNYTDGGAYLTSHKVAPGGLIDRMLSDYPNLFGDLSAPSGLLQLGRDPEFTAGFFKRHQHKLIYGSDCGCADGHGGGGPMAAGMPMLPGGVPAPGAPPAGAARPPGAIDSSTAAAMQMRMAAMGGLGGKCIGRELLKIVWKTTDRDVFRKIAWQNGVREYKLDVA